MFKIIFFVLLVLLGKWCLAQPTFQRIYKDTNVSLMYRSAVEIDSGFVVIGMGQLPGTGQNENDAFYVYLDEQGNCTPIYIDHEDNTRKRPGFSGSNLYKNTDSTCFTFHTCYDYNQNISQVRYQEFGFDGQIYQDQYINWIYDSLQYSIFDRTSSIKLNDDSYVFATNSTSFHPDSSQFNQSIAIFRTNQNHETEFVLNVRDFENNDAAYAVLDLDTLVNGNVIVTGQSNNGLNGNNQKVDILFIELDQNLNFLRKKKYAKINTHQATWSGVYPTLDTGLILPHWEGYWVPNNPNFPNVGTWDYLNKVSKFDKDFNLEWSFFTNDNDSINGESAAVREVKRTTDSNYIAISGGVIILPVETYDSTTNQFISRIPTSVFTKFDDYGNIIWQREHTLFNKVFDEPSYCSNYLWDIIPTEDNGFLGVGQYCFHAYAIKLNCLGFLEDPIASAQYSSENNYLVNFTNTSAMAGSYSWYFGDGDTLHTDEYTTQVSHTYPDYGTYTVTLVAHGCGDIADTIQYQVTAQQNINGDKIVEGDNGVFTIFPNPSNSGGFINIYLHQDITIENPVIKIYNLQGQVVQEVAISKKQGTYHIFNNLAAGTYSAVLKYDGKLICKRLVVL